MAKKAAPKKMLSKGMPPKGMPPKGGMHMMPNGMPNGMLMSNAQMDQIMGKKKGKR